MLKLFGSPGRYIQGPGASADIGAYAAKLGARAAIVADPFVIGMIGDDIAASCSREGVSPVLVPMTGEITHPVIATLVEAARTHGTDVVIATGGGKSIDAGKAVCNALGTKLITMPTAASNDAPTSKNYVVYDDAHQLVAVEHLPFSPDYVVVDTTLLAKAPKALLRAGIGDALSKKFEAEQCFAAGGPNMFGFGSTLAAQMIADGCFRILRADAEAALEAAETGAPNPAFERAIEATLLLSGLGFESGGLSIAHALTRGWPIVPGAASAPHGFQVAFGLIVQLSLERRQDDVLADLQAWYPRLGLPRTLAELGGGGAPPESIREAARRTLAAAHARNFSRAVDEDELASCIESLRG